MRAAVRKLSVVGGVTGGGRGSSVGRNSTVRERKAEQDTQKELLAKAIALSKEKSLKKAIDFLIREQILAESPQDIASWLRINHDQLSEVEIGDYLGESDIAFKKNVRMAYLRAISFLDTHRRAERLFK